MSEPSATDLARALAARRSRVPHVCAQCGTLFQGLKHAKYCGSACLERARYLRHLDARRARSREYMRRRAAAAREAAAAPEEAPATSGTPAPWHPSPATSGEPDERR